MIVVLVTTTNSGEQKNINMEPNNNLSNMSISKSVVIPPTPKISTIDSKIRIQNDSQNKTNSKDSILTKSEPVKTEHNNISTNHFDEVKVNTSVQKSNRLNITKRIQHDEDDHTAEVIEIMTPNHIDVSFEDVQRDCTDCKLNEIDSYWSETNSWSKKSFRDQPFDQSDEGNYYVPAKNVIEDVNIIDVTYFDHNMIYLYNNNVLRIHNKKYRLKAQETKSYFECIVSFGNNLFALADGGIYVLYKQRANRWSFKQVDSSYNDLAKIVANTDGVIRLSSGVCLTVQTIDKLYLLDENFNLIRKIKYDQHHKRVYGNSLEIYADINLIDNIAKLSTSKVRFVNVVDAVISHSNNLIPITLERQEQYGYTSVRLVEGELYFLKHP